MIIKINELEEYKINLPEKDDIIKLDQFFQLISRLHIISKSFMKDPLLEITKDIKKEPAIKKYNYPTKTMKIETKEECIRIAKDYFFLTKEDFNKKYSPNRTTDFGVKFFSNRNRFNIFPVDVGFKQWPSISQSKQKNFKDILIK